MNQTKVGMVARALANEIVAKRRSNELFLESEHELMVRFKCSRHTVREACERLIGSGLIFKRFGEGIWFTDPDGWPLERLADELLALRTSGQAHTLLRDLLTQHRLCMGEIGQLAAERWGDGDLGLLEMHLSVLRRSLEYQDDQRIAREEGELLSQFIETAASRAFRLSLNAFNHLYLRLDIRRPTGKSWSTPSTWASLIDTLRRRSTSVARVLAMEMTRPIHAAVEQTFCALLPPVGLAGEATPSPG